jgi:hypothetical protein
MAVSPNKVAGDGVRCPKEEKEVVFTMKSNPG